MPEEIPDQPDRPRPPIEPAGPPGSGGDDPPPPWNWTRITVAGVAGCFLACLGADGHGFWAEVVFWPGLLMLVLAAIHGAAASGSSGTGACSPGSSGRGRRWPAASPSACLA